MELVENMVGGLRVCRFGGGERDEEVAMVEVYE
jgi:hypothetical protein